MLYLLLLSNITLQFLVGADMETVSARAGHARASTTSDFYSHFITDRDIHASEIIVKYLNKLARYIADFYFYGIIIKGVDNMDKSFKWHLFFTSFIPLWISITIINIWKSVEWLINEINNELSTGENIVNFLKCNYLSIALILSITILLLVSTISLNKFLKNKIKEKNKPYCKIIEAKHGSNLTADFILSYILPMIAFNFTSLLDVILFLIYFSVLAFVCIRNNNVYINFFFEVKGYRMYYCKLQCMRANELVEYAGCLVISRKHLDSEINKSISYWDFENKIYIDIKKE